MTSILVLLCMDQPGELTVMLIIKDNNNWEHPCLNAVKFI